MQTTVDCSIRVAIAFAVAIWFTIPSMGLAQQPSVDPGLPLAATAASQVSSEDFLRVVDSINGHAPRTANVPTYTFPQMDANGQPPANGIQQATAIDTPQSSPMIGEGVQVADPIGSGIHGVPKTLEYLPNQGPVSKERRYHFTAGYDAIWLKRQGNDSYPITNAPLLGNLGTEFSGRYMIGTVDGDESSQFVFTGPFHWERGWDPNRWIDRTDESYPLVSTIQRQSSQLSSYELNDVWSSDGLSSTMSGWRIIDYDEKLTSISPGLVGKKRLSQTTNNLLLGFQFGGTIVRPVSQRLSFGSQSVLGGFVNFARSSYSLTDNQVLTSVDRDRGARLAGLLQLGFHAHYRLTSRTKLNFGYEMWYIPGMATVSNNPPGSLTPGSTIRLRADDDVLFHGTVFGIDSRF